MQKQPDRSTRSLKFWAWLILKSVIMSAVILYLLLLMLLAARLDGYIGRLDQIQLSLGHFLFKPPNAILASSRI